jgi:dihydrofolate reductase
MGMGRIVISENVSLDGVIQDPTGEEGLGRGSWFASISTEDREAWAKGEHEEALAASALLMGRRTYSWFVMRGWPTRSGAWADRLRELPKYVVSSSTLEGPDWGSASVVRADALPTLARHVDGEVVVYGSGRLARALLEQGLVDELRLTIYPIVVGAGERLFGETRDVRPFRLVASRTIGDGLAAVTYQRP